MKDNISHEAFSSSESHQTHSGRIEHSRSYKLKRAAALGGLVVSTFIAASHPIENTAHQATKVMDYATGHLDDLMHGNNVQNDFNTFNFANNKAYEEVLKHDGLTDKDVTVYTINDSEFTDHDVAVDLHAKNPEKFTNMMRAQLSDPVTQVEGNIQGRTIAVPNSMLNK